MPQLNPEIAITIPTLIRGCEGIEAVKNTRYGYPAATQDIDIAV